MTPLTSDELDELIQLEAEEDYLCCEESLYRFFLSAWKVLEPATDLYSNWHLELMCEHLEEVTAGKIQRLVINVPPRSLKSTIVTICWPVWEWLRRASKRKMFASYSQTLSTEHSIARRRLIESDWFQARWGERFLLSDDQNTKHYFKNDSYGHMFATSTGGTATGMGGDDVVVDDPHNTKQAESEAERTTTLNDFDKGLMTRLNDPKKGAVVVVMQRLHESDVTGHLLAKKIPGLVHLCLPTIAEKNETITFPRSLRKVVRRTGDLLHPERLGEKEVTQAKLDLGSFGFAGQHQQTPAPEAGGLLKTANWRRYHPSDRPEQFDQVALSWDMRFKRTTSEQSKNKGDYVVGVCLGMIGSKIYLLDIVRGLWGFKDSLDQVVALSKRWPDAMSKYVENKANGPGIVDALEDEVPGLTLVEPKGDKRQRVLLTVPAHEAGNLWIPEAGHVFYDGETIDDFVRECAMFPSAQHDDRVDAYTQGIIELQGSGYNYLRIMAGMGRIGA